MAITKIELEKPKDRTMWAAIQSVKPQFTDEVFVTSDTNGGFVTFNFIGFSGLEMFKIGRIYQNLLMQ